jgi:hypothetical protein
MTDRVLSIRPSGPHPLPEQLYRARRGPRTAEAERWLAHAAACAVCTEELLRQEAFDAPQAVAPGDLAAAWERFGEPQAPLAPVISIGTRSPALRPAAPRSGRRTGLAVAAALLSAAVGLGLWTSTQRAQPSSPPILRGGGEAAGAWEPAGVLDAPPQELRFPASADGASRRIKVFDASATYAWTSPPATGGRIVFPETERKKLRRGVEYFWMVMDTDTAARSFRLR